MKRLNNLYYSKRIKELLAELQTAGTTLVVAPMGYGKTLAVQYFLQEQERCGKKVLRQSIYGAGAEAFWQGVCHSWQNTELGAALLQQSLPADANAKTLVLELFRQLLPQEPVYWFIDDLHLLESSEAIAKVKPTAVLLNTARGPVVDSEALAQALNEGRLAGAGIDVFEGEPPIAPEHPLCHAKNTVLTPHVAFASAEALAARADIVFANIEKWLAGTPQNVIK